MSKESAVINEVLKVPIISAYSAIGPFIEIRRVTDDEWMVDLFSLNVQTGEALMPQRDQAGQLVLDADGKHIMNTVHLDLRDFYIAFKSKR